MCQTQKLLAVMPQCNEVQSSGKPSSLEPVAYRQRPWGKFSSCGSFSMLKARFGIVSDDQSVIQDWVSAAVVNVLESEY